MLLISQKINKFMKIKYISIIICFVFVLPNIKGYEIASAGFTRPSAPLPGTEGGGKPPENSVCPFRTTNQDLLAQMRRIEGQPASLSEKEKCQERASPPSSAGGNVPSGPPPGVIEG
jgi:hypothetical protein